MLNTARIRDQKDFTAGCIYVAAGLGFGLGATEYRMGDAARMGPGYFPFWVGMLMAAVGMVLIAASMRPSASTVKMARFSPMTGVWILGSIVLFGLLLQPLGLVLSLVVLVMTSSMASHEFTWRGAIANTVVLLVISVAAFVWGVSLQIPLWPEALMY